MTAVSDIRNKRIAAFVRGYFGWLEKQGFEVAILHQWESKFEKNVSDIDYVIEPRGFHQLLDIVSVYCREQGWQLCQVFRHENTAAFCVCSASDDPSCVIALDACTDYQRRGFLLLRYKDLLNGREVLPWGGYRLAPPIEMRYRFIKGAVKSKDPANFVPIFNQYSDSARSELEKWLMERWKLLHTKWDEVGISHTWRDLERLTRKAKVAGWLTGFTRILLRLRQPSGLLVVGMNDAQDAAVSRCFGHLYFRRQMKVGCFRPTLYRNLIASTLIRCKRVGGIWKRLLGDSLCLEAEPDESPCQLTERIAAHLEKRCALREGLYTLQ